MVRIGGGAAPPSGGIIGKTAEAWEFLPTGIPNVFWMYQASATPFFAMTGSAVPIKISFKVPFTLIAIMLEHTDAGTPDALNTNSLTWTFGTYPAPVPFFGIDTTTFPFIKYSTTTLSQIMATFEDFPDAMLPLPAGDYLLSMNTTNLHRIRVRFLVKLPSEEDET